MCVAFSDSSRLVHYSIVNVAKNSFLELIGCHLLTKVIGENLFATTLYVCYFQSWGVRKVVVKIIKDIFIRTPWKHTFLGLVLSGKEVNCIVACM